MRFHTRGMQPRPLPSEQPGDHPLWDVVNTYNALLSVAVDCEVQRDRICPEYGRGSLADPDPRDRLDERTRDHFEFLGLKASHYAHAAGMVDAALSNAFDWLS